MAKIKKLAIILPDSKAKAPEVLTYGKAVHTGMSAHREIFSSPMPSVEALKTALDELETANVSEANRSDNTDIVLEEKRMAVMDILEPQSRYVLLVADGDRSKAAKSGFKLNVAESVKKVPGEFKAVFVRPGTDAGTAVINIEERAGNAFFLVMLWVEDKWVMIDGFNTLTFAVEGLPPGESKLRIYGKKGKRKSPVVDLLVRAS